MKITFNIRYHTGSNNYDGLNMYYGADSLGGAAEALAITTHAIINNKVITQTPSTKGFSLDFKESHTGSYVQKVELTFTDEEAIRVINYLKPQGFMELLTFHLASPLGLRPKIETEVAQRWFRSYMEDSEELLDRLARPLERIHHPVSGQGYQVTISKNRTPFVSFNEATLDYLTGSNVSQAVEVMEVAVSRFNARTATGRFIEDETADSISFSPPKAGLPRAAKILLAGSLKNLAEERITMLTVEVRRVLSRDGRTKHLLLQTVNEL